MAQTNTGDLEPEPSRHETVLRTRGISNSKTFHRTVDGETPVCGAVTQYEEGWRDIELLTLRGHYDQCGACKHHIEGTWSDKCADAQQGSH